MSCRATKIATKIQNPLDYQGGLADRTGLEPNPIYILESISYKSLLNCTHRIAHYFTPH